LAAGTALVLIAVPPTAAVVIEVTGVRAISGSTILVSKAGSPDMRVRLLGIRAPNARSCFAARARSLLHDAVAGRRLKIIPVGNAVSREFRGYVHRGRLDLGAFLLTRGFAVTDSSAEFRRKAAYRRIEAHARRTQQGMWGSCPSTDLSIEVTDSPDPVPLGADLTYRLSIRNVGPLPAEDIVVDDDLPKALDWRRRGMSISVPGRCSLTTATWKVRCTIGRMAPRGSAEITITVLPRAAGMLENVAVVRSAVRDRDQANNSAVEQTTVLTGSAGASTRRAIAPVSALGNGLDVPLDPRVARTFAELLNSGLQSAYDVLGTGTWWGARADS
jgi:uncharacterized repeat protein (TIGR01451 family)